MSKTIKVTLIIATICIISGIILSGIAFAAAGFDFRRFSNGTPAVSTTYVAQSTDCQTITIKGISENYRITQGSGSRIEVIYYEDEQTSFSIEEHGNTLVVTEKYKFVFMLFNFDFNSFQREVVISVPADFTGVIELNTSSGNIRIQGLDDCSSLQVSTKSGNINCDGANVSKNLSLSSLSGNITCKRVQADDLSLKATSGDVVCEDVTVKRDLSVDVTSGNITTDRLQAATISLQTRSGDIKVNVLSVTNLTCHATSGNINATVKGNENAYRIAANSVSGRTTVPSGNTNAAGRITLDTVSGDIRLAFVS